MYTAEPHKSYRVEGKQFFFRQVYRTRLHRNCHSIDSDWDKNSDLFWLWLPEVNNSKEIRLLVQFFVPRTRERLLHIGWNVKF